MTNSDTGFSKWDSKKRRIAVRITSRKMKAILDKYDREMNNEGNRDEILEALASKYHKSTRQIERYISKQREIEDSKRKAETKDIVREELTEVSKQQTKLEASSKIQDSILRDRNIFGNSNAIMSEQDFGNLFILLSHNSFLRSQQYKLFQYLEYFKSERNRYADWHLNFVSIDLCNKLKELLWYTETDSCERDTLLFRYEDEFKEKSVDNPFKKIIKRLLEDTSYMPSPELDELYLMVDDKSLIWIDVPELSDNFSVEHYLEWQKEFNRLVNNTESAYKAYLVAVREILST